MSIGIGWVDGPQESVPVHVALNADEKGYVTIHAYRADTNEDVAHWFKIVGDVYVCPVTGREMWVQP